MTDFPANSRLNKVSVEGLRRFLLSYGFYSRGKWGSFLERFQFEHEGQYFDVLVPLLREIADFRDRIRDAIRDTAAAIGESPSAVLSQVLTSEFRTFKIRAHPGSDIASIPFEEGFSLLANGKSLVRLSAIQAYSKKTRRFVRGRAPLVVDEYMDRVQLGQSDVGSYVFTLLLPREDEFFKEGSPQSSGSDFGSVAEFLEDGIALAAEMAATKQVPAMDRLEKVGLTANFCESLYNIISWSENVVLEVGHNEIAAKRELREYKFDTNALSVLERTASRLAPDEKSNESTFIGTITRLSEPQIRRRGSVDLRVRIGGRFRSIRVAFDFADRETVIKAFREKASMALAVVGVLKTGRNGHLTLEQPRDFALTRRGGLV